MTRAAGFTATAALLLALGGCGARETPEEAVASSFQRFLAAVADGDGGDAADELSADTLALFQEAVDRAVDEDLGGASPAMRAAVWAARLTWSASQLEDMDGAELCAEMVGEKWVVPYLDREIAFDVLEIDGADATIAVGTPDLPRRPRLQFVEEDGRWKLDLAAARRDADDIARDLFRFGGGSEEDAVRMVLGR